MAEESPKAAPPYRATADEFLLYSVGDNGRDDGGDKTDGRSFNDDHVIRIRSKPLPPIKSGKDS